MKLQKNAVPGIIVLAMEFFLKLILKRIGVKEYIQIERFVWYL
jgi:hypothetical protein